MSFIASLDLDKLTATRLWMSLPRTTRAQAATAYLTANAEDPQALVNADMAIADAMRFRPASVRKLTVEKKAQYLASAIRPDDALASMLLQAHHLASQSALLGAFLDALGISHEDGAIDDETDYEIPEADDLAKAAKTLYDGHPAEDVDMYLATLYAIEHDVWGGLRSVLDERAAA